MLILPPRVQRFVAHAAATTYPVLLLGETGSGKTHVARAIHELGGRAGNPFVHVNCPAIPENLFEREMFGNERGAFTDAKETRIGFFQAADGGTLFLDEIGELPLALQPKLLRALEDGVIRRLGSTRTISVDLKLIVATNQDLGAAIRERRFRQDLYYRCAVLCQEIPPLRERLADLPEIASALLRRAGSGTVISAEVLRALQVHSWPGNIRELDNALRHALAFSNGNGITVDHLPRAIRNGEVRIFGAQNSSRNGTRSRYVAPDDPALERRQILAALDAEGGNRTRAARRLGMARASLWSKLQRHDIRQPDV
jgi:two-component system response regulator HydG